MATTKPSTDRETRHSSQQALEAHLWGAANLLRGLVDAGDYKQYVFPLLCLQAPLRRLGRGVPRRLRRDRRRGLRAGDGRRPVRRPRRRALVRTSARRPATSAGRCGTRSGPSRRPTPSGWPACSGPRRGPTRRRCPTRTLSLAAVPEDELGNAYEYLVKQFADDSGHTAQEFYTNRTLVHLMTRMLRPRPGERIYDPTAGTGGMLISALAEARRRPDARPLGAGDHRRLALLGAAGPAAAGARGAGGEPRAGGAGPAEPGGRGAAGAGRPVERRRAGRRGPPHAGGRPRRRMRRALPNAFLFGLTGTPINRADRNTFFAFGADEDESDYLSRYGFEESIRDGATMPLHFEPRLPELHVDREAIDAAFGELTGGLSDLDRDRLSKTAARTSVLLKTPARIERICADVARHFQEKVAPDGFGAQVVACDREGCALYKRALDRGVAARDVRRGRHRQPRRGRVRRVAPRPGRRGAAARPLPRPARPAEDARRHLEAAHRLRRAHSPPTTAGWPACGKPSRPRRPWPRTRPTTAG